MRLGRVRRAGARLLFLSACYTFRQGKFYAMKSSEVGGIVLCGGQSSRMGRPKAWLPIAGELMLPRVVRLLSQVVAPVVVVAAPEQDVPPLPAEVTLVRDEEQGR